MTQYSINYRRLSELGNKVRQGTATDKERDEFMQMLYMNGSITEKQYNDFRANRNTEDIVKTGLAIGAVILVGYILGQLFSSK